MDKCDHPNCEADATDDIGGLHFCPDHEDWALQALDDREFDDWCNGEG